MGRKSKSEIRKPEILENLYKVINKEGLEGTTLAKVADEMGVNSGLLVHYFKTKEEMIVSMVDYMLEKYANIYVAKLNEYEKPKDRMDNMLNTFFELEWTMRGDAAVFWSCYSLSRRNDRVKEQFEKMYQGFRNLLAYEIQLYRGAGIAKVSDPFLAADIIISLIEGLYFYHNAIGESTKIDDAVKYIKRTVTHLLEYGDDVE
ncbi:TetR/AcrR family transcriptional regulator [bacterium]|nr:TetR/AcrR family transcriptional regulator [bacterium]